MARYDVLSTQLQNTIYTNTSGDISGNVLRNQLIAFINTLGKGSSFMGILTDSNKPTSIPDGKQFYIGYNNSSTALSVNLTAVGLGTLSITRTKIYVVYCDDNGWAAVDIASGISTSIPTNVNQLTGYDYLEHKEEVVEVEGGDVSIEEMQSNTAYVIAQCTSLSINSYGYDTSSIKECITLQETHIVVEAAADFTMAIPTGSMLNDGSSLNIENGGTYLITVKGIFWKIEKYS